MGLLVGCAIQEEGWIENVLVCKCINFQSNCAFGE